MNGQNIPFVSHVKFLSVIFDEIIIRRMHAETTADKTFRIFVHVYFPFKIKRLNVNIKLSLYKALITSITILSSPTWESVADTYVLKLQHLQNRVLRTPSNFPRCTLTRQLHVAFKIPYVCDCHTIVQEAS